MEPGSCRRRLVEGEGLRAGDTERSRQGQARHSMQGRTMRHGHLRIVRSRDSLETDGIAVNADSHTATLRHSEAGRPMPAHCPAPPIDIALRPTVETRGTADALHPHRFAGLAVIAARRGRAQPYRRLPLAPADYYAGKTIELIVGGGARRRLRHLRARGGAPPRPPHPRRADHRGQEHAGRGQRQGRAIHRRHRAQGRHRRSPASCRARSWARCSTTAPRRCSIRPRCSTSAPPTAARASASR